MLVFCQGANRLETKNATAPVLERRDKDPHRPITKSLATYSVDDNRFSVGLTNPAGRPVFSRPVITLVTLRNATIVVLVVFVLWKCAVVVMKKISRSQSSEWLMRSQ